MQETFYVGIWILFKGTQYFLFYLKKLFLFLRYLSFCLDYLVTLKNGLIRKIRLISKFMTSCPGKQTISIHTLPNISKSKGKHTMKFCQLRECNMRNMQNIFVKKWYTNCGGEAIPRLVFEKSKLSISMDQ